MTENPNLEQLLNHIEETTAKTERVHLGQVVDAVGRRSFGPLLAVVGLILASPLSIIPSLPTTMGVLVIMISGQMLFHRTELWLPQWLRKRSVEKTAVDKALRRMLPVARFIDRWLKRRLTILVNDITEHLISGLCIALALFMPLMEVVPMSASSAGAVFASYGLALVYHDGLLALMALILTGGLVGLLFYFM